MTGAYIHMDACCMAEQTEIGFLPLVIWGLGCEIELWLMFSALAYQHTAKNNSNLDKSPCVSITSKKSTHVQMQSKHIANTDHLQF
jgi:hypothetical protein